MRRIMVLVGGRSSEREISLVTGEAIARALEAGGDEVRLLDTGRLQQPALSPAEFEAQAQLSAGGDGADAAPGERLLARSLEGPWQPDLAFLALHGGMGEDGTVQGVLDWLGVPYTGAGLAASSLAMDKMASKRIFRDAGIAVPEGFLQRIPTERRGDPALVAELSDAIEAAIGFPAVAKPRREGSSVGLAILQDREEASLKLPRVIQLTDELLLEVFIPGREITAGILGGADEARVLPLVEILPESGLYDYEHKYTQGRTRYVCPAELSEDLAGRIRDEARLVWDLLGCRHFARVDFRLAPDDTPYCLELNTIPGMTPTSLLPMAAQAAGIDFPALVAEIARLALEP
jgi:D-alanine-D-alanine ligase